MDSVCRFIAECSEEGLPIEYIELNLSMKQCVQMDLTDKVFDHKINTILKYNIRLLKEIGMEIVVEGVETEEVYKGEWPGDRHIAT